jgi:hypothetical protein
LINRARHRASGTIPGVEIIRLDVCSKKLAHTQPFTTDVLFICARSNQGDQQKHLADRWLLLYGSSTANCNK